jgi:hypothetical protein
MDYSVVGRRKEKEGRIHGEAVGSWSHRQMDRPEERQAFSAVSHMENRCVDDVHTRLAVSSDLHVALGWWIGVSYSILSSPLSVFIRDAPIYNGFYLWKRLLTVPWLIWAWLTVAFIFLYPLRGGLVSRFGILFSLNFDEKLANLASSGTYLIFSVIRMCSKITEEYYKDSNWENYYAIYSKYP